ncbi:hypothetical protein KSC_046130 [Ktedonobacter sp. SOSP1-52]|uniref:hypothetical protein n=1 Tax=Ktedonobacter sp. SOSP1-52 TaxID=2778366 RepID=UPI0019167E84|nr:hypothetical protein [Ktedonobacter sp. SOSP1-52]GHO65721.1 hypothetical protein KSC_046130 [Ktedonobacter sp. SOSP1-52]
MMFPAPTFSTAVIVFFVVFLGGLWLLHKLNISLKAAVVLVVALLVISVTVFHLPVVGQLVALIQHH